jgi:hypothetical protein
MLAAAASVGALYIDQQQQQQQQQQTRQQRQPRTLSLSHHYKSVSRMWPQPWNSGLISSVSQMLARAASVGALYVDQQQQQQQQRQPRTLSVSHHYNRVSRMWSQHWNSGLISSVSQMLAAAASVGALYIDQQQQQQQQQRRHRFQASAAITTE